MSKQEIGFSKNKTTLTSGKNGVSILISIIIYIFLPSDEGRIKKLFKEGSEAIEKEDLDAVMSKVSFNYQDEYGMSYLYLKEAIKSIFQYYNF
ncbi:MAG: hypothetical protein ACPL1G_05760 [Thermodesulfovibrionales bacterium]